jgi:hypothetical protein
MWGRKYKTCSNCGTTNRPHRRRGYCNKCYGPAIQLDEIRAWDQSRPETLRRYRGNAGFASEEEFLLIKEAVSLELQGRLDTLKHWEQSHARPADGIEIEHQLDRLAEYAGAKSCGLFHGYAGYIDSQFSGEQRKKLRDLLQIIETDVPWRGVNWGRVLRYKNEHLRRDAPTSEG